MLVGRVVLLTNEIRALDIRKVVSRVTCIATVYECAADG